ncbi:MAG: hypothetical protein V4550_01950 [Gemmatimonadota bacterium]
MSRHAVLVLSVDPLAAALIAASVELSELAPHFAQQGESARAALRRVRPRLVVIDCAHEEGCSDEFVGPALMMGARTVLIRSHREPRAIDDFAERLGLRVFDMPQDHEELTRLFAELLAE